MTIDKSGEEELRLWRGQASEEELRLWHNLDASIRRNQDRLDEAAGWDYEEEDEEEKLGYYMTDAERQAIAQAGGANLEDNPYYEEFPDEEEWLATMTDAERQAYEDDEQAAWCAEQKPEAKKDGCLFWPFLFLAAVGVNLVVQLGRWV